MNIFQTIIKDAQSIASKVEKFLAEVEGAAPTIERITASTLLVVGPLLQTVVTMTAGAPTGALVGGVIAQIQTKLAAVSQLTSAAGTSGSVSDLLAGVSSDLSDLDSVAAIKDPKAQANLALVIKDVEALLAAYKPVPAASAPAPTPAPAPAPTHLHLAPQGPDPAPAQAAPALETEKVPAAESDSALQAGPGLHALFTQ
ncbi:MAG TPA: hypothetical protein VK574_07560 [Terracidiphilus sp.]|nr:hypothetical protein [Terracidiphilus sp.]